MLDEALVSELNRRASEFMKRSSGWREALYAGFNPNLSPGPVSKRSSRPGRTPGAPPTAIRRSGRINVQLFRPVASEIDQGTQTQ